MPVGTIQSAPMGVPLTPTVGAAMVVNQEEIRLTFKYPDM
jgi:hypothetical protein